MIQSAMHVPCFSTCHILLDWMQTKWWSTPDHNLPVRKYYINERLISFSGILRGQTWRYSNSADNVIEFMHGSCRSDF